MKQNEELYDKYPMLFRQKDLSAQETCMCWGIACGDGWFNIIDDACKELTELAKANNAVIEFVQVKEKFGGLRLYIEIKQENKETERAVVLDIMLTDSLMGQTLTTVPNETIWQKAHAITRKAEELSYKTCDVCGAPGEPRTGGWIVTRCNDHLVKKQSPPTDPLTALGITDIK
jgi:hypothetical protein